MSLLHNIASRRIDALRSQGRSQGVELSGPPALPRDLLKSECDAVDARPETDRASRGGYLHVSSLLGFCPRRRVLALRHPVAEIKTVQGGMRVVWARGRAAEAHVKDAFMRANRAVIYGDWKCLCGALRHTGHYPGGKSCGRCQRRAGIYTGCTLFDHEHRVVGSADLCVRWFDTYVPVEIKSLDDRERFKELTVAQPDHVIQVLSYRRLLATNRLPVHPEVVILYVLTSYRHGSPYKEIHLTPSAEQLALVDSLFAMAGEARRAIDDGSLPPRLPQCGEDRGGADSRTAKACARCALCFSL